MPATPDERTTPNGGETANLIGSDEVEGTAVRTSDGQSVGTIARLMIEKASGRVAYAVVDVGGFLGLGVEHRTLPWSVLDYDPALGAYAVSLSQAQLGEAPRPQSDGYDASFDRDWEEHVHRYFSAAPYWSR